MLSSTTLCTYMPYLLRALHHPMSACYCGLNIFYVVHQLCCPGSRARPCCLTKCWGSLGPEQASWHQEPGPRAIRTRQGPNSKLTHRFSPMSFHAVFGNIWFPAKKKKAQLTSQKKNILTISILLIARQMAWIHLTWLGRGCKDLVWTRACEASSGGPCSLWDCCVVSDSMGGRLSLLVPYEDTAGLIHGWGRDGKGHPFYLIAHHHQNRCFLFMQARIKPGYKSISALRLSDSHSSLGISFMNLSHFNKVYFTILSLLWNKHHL